MLLATIVKLVGFWRLRRLAHSARLRSWRRVLFFVYTHYLESMGSYIALESQLGDNLVFPHKPTGVFIAPGAVIGDRVTIFQQVTIGVVDQGRGRYPGAPTVGDDCTLSAGAVLVGGITIGSHVTVGANTTVVTDIPDNSTVVGPPARVLER